MNKILLPLVMLFSSVIIMTSCLSSDDDTYTYSDDTAITSFTLGTLNRYLHTKTKSGKDSTYKATVTGSNYRFYIDHQNKEIYNPDSLPFGTDAKHVLATIATKNSGITRIKSMTSDSLFFFSSSDSLDFSQPRQIRIDANSGNSYRIYTVRVNVHKEEADSFKWHKVSMLAFMQKYTHMKAFNLNQRMFLFGTDGNTTELSLSQESNGADWVVSNAELDADAWMNVAVSGNTLYVKNGSTLMKTTDGSSWTLLSSTVGISKLVGATTARLYGISAEGMLVASEDEGVTWAAETLDSDVSMLPTRSINYSCNAVTTNEKTDRIILVGTRDITAYPNDTTAVVWGKVDEYAERAISHAWTYYTPDMQNHLMLPRLSNLSAISYAGGILAIGGNGEGACTAKGYQRFYQSTDGGITWLNNKYYPMPAGLNVGTSAALATDSQKNIWIFCGGSGQIWRGRQNKMGWAEVQKKFQE